MVVSAQHETASDVEVGARLGIDTGLARDHRGQCTGRGQFGASRALKGC